ncbi:hypothetical protein B9Y01_18365 [Acinetobacter baumannii]|nr:hypothetical protein B9Y01_18365 [Acinetobacter baumannii]OTM19602.1 hypothetical protein B9X53_04920 [Acinetobacter pittii]
MIKIFYEENSKTSWAVTKVLSKLESYLSALSRMHFDDDLPSDEFNAIMCGLHLQVHEICQQIKA